MEKARAERGFVAELDGLRGIAILLVMVHRFWPRSDAGFAADLAGSGWIGVDLFFVISGFLITGILLETRGEPTYFRNFYVRRVLRIFPLYYLFVGTILAVFSWNPAFREHAGSPLWYLFYLGNIPEGLLGHDVPYWLGPVWSLAIEEQFYLTFPWLVAYTSRKRLTAILLGILAFAPIVRIVTMAIDPAHERVQYLFTLCRLDTIAIGCLLAIFMRSIDVERHRALLRKVGLGVFAGVATIAIITGLDRTTAFGRIAGYSFVALGAGSIVMLVMLARGQRSTAPLRAVWLRYFGKLCFGLYLLHRPADTLVGGLAVRAGFDTAALWLIPIKIAAALVLATISWRLLEQPILSLKSAFGGIRHPGHGTVTAGAQPRLHPVVRALRQVVNAR
jgi:peptidoglycan/LPS O-acetylase OafA/YrhL